MIQSADPLDRLVEIYLTAVEQASAGLSAQRRDELIADLREHIAVARAESGADTESSLRTILEKLGDPAAIAAEARLSEPVGVSTIAAAGARRSGWLTPLAAAVALGAIAIFVIIVSGTLVVTLGGTATP